MTLEHMFDNVKDVEKEPDDVIDERRRQAQAVAAEQSKAMEAGFRHLLGHADPTDDEGDEDQ